MCLKIVKLMVRSWSGWWGQGNLILQNSNWVIRKASKSCQSGRLKTHETFIFWLMEFVKEFDIYAAAAWWKHIGNTYAKWKHIWTKKTERIAEVHTLTMSNILCTSCHLWNIMQFFYVMLLRRCMRHATSKICPKNPTGVIWTLQYSQASHGCLCG